MGLTQTEADELRDRFHIDRIVVSQRAKWCADDPGAPPNTCRYCGRRWDSWARSRLDGHAACMVSESFKQHVGQILRAPTVTFASVADVLGVTTGTVRSWAVSAGIGPIGHPLMRGQKRT